MRPNLDSLTEEIQQFLDGEHFVTFRSMSRMGEHSPVVGWDTHRVPDFRQFLDCAMKLGVRLVHFHQREFTRDHREDALTLVESADAPKEERREWERRIEEFVIYEGFLCAIELTFDFDGRIYLFALETEWFEEWESLLDEIEMSTPDFEDDDDDEPYGGGFYSSN